MKKQLFKNGFFGEFGGRYVPEMLLPALNELEKAYMQFRNNPVFSKELGNLLRTFAGRPTPLYYAENLSRHLGKGKIWFKCESLAHTGAHKINNVLGQALLARKMGKKRIIAETGAGQHGLATAAAAAKLGLECEIFMGQVDAKRQHPNVFWMKTMGAKVTEVKFGNKTLKDAVNASLKNWIETLDHTHYCLGSVLGPHPYPLMVRDFQCVIGKEAKTQILKTEKRLPDYIFACVGGGSNSLGIFHEFLESSNVRLIGVEAGGSGIKSGKHAARFQEGTPGIAQAYKSYFLQNKDGQLRDTHSISAGLDYAGVGPELACLQQTGRVEFIYACDAAVIEAVTLCARLEGIIPALESAHALAGLISMKRRLKKHSLCIVNISGRGDKDLFILAKNLDRDNWKNFLLCEAESV